MRPPIHDQISYLDRTDHAEQGLNCEATGDEGRSMTRQEFKHELDINTILWRFKVSGVLPPPRPPMYGDHDFDLDLHTGFIALADAQRAFLRLPKELRDKYQTPAGMLDAVHSGDFKKDMEAIELAKTDAEHDATIAAADRQAKRTAEKQARVQAESAAADATLREKVMGILSQIQGKSS